MSDREIKLMHYLDLPGKPRGRDRWTAAERFGPSQYASLARDLEDALFDGVFRADGAGPPNIEWLATSEGPSHDAFQHLAAIAPVTKHLGLVGTASSTFNLPYAFARQLLTLDHLSGGRVGWNAVTSFEGEKAFGLGELPPQGERYARATEFLEVVHGLWGSWQPGALDVGQDTARYANPDLIKPLTYHGKYFDVEGVATLPRSPQGWPVQFQAGASGSAKPFAARFAEGIYSASPSIEHARQFYSEIKRLVGQAGRNPQHTLIFPGFHPYLAKTRAEAEEKFRAAGDGVDIAAGLRELERQFGDVDYSALDLDEPIPGDLLPATETLRRRQSRPGLYADIARQPGVTLRHVIQRVATASGHYMTYGSYDDVADELELWFTTGAADGFAIGFVTDNADGFDDFIEQVVPRLQDKGLFRRKYQGTTLRENLGLPIPPGALERW